MQSPTAYGPTQSDPSITSDLGGRWRQARRAALLRALGRASTPTEGADEAALLTEAQEGAREATLELVFDHSQRLGASFVRYHSLSLTIVDVARLLDELETPCLRSRWQIGPEVGVGRRSQAGCGCQATRYACEYFREATSGLVCGMTSWVRFARLSSAGTGADACVEVLYVHPESPARFAPLPGELAEGLEAVKRTVALFAPGTELEFVGLREDALFYRLGGERACEDMSSPRVGPLLAQAVQRRFPHLKLHDVAPRGVLPAAD